MEHRAKVIQCAKLNAFKVNSKRLRKTSIPMSLLFTMIILINCFHSFYQCSIFFIDFEHVIFEDSCF